MKRILIILTTFIFASLCAVAQDDNEGSEKIRERMKEFIQRRMHLSKAEAERFSPVFIRYFREWRQTVNANRQDKLILQQKIVELRLRYRQEFREIVGERRSNEVYQHQEVFMRELRDLQQQRMRQRETKQPNKKLRSLLQ